MISKLCPLARACFSLSLVCARLALRLAQLLCVRSRVAVFRFSVRFLRVALGEARRHLHRQTARARSTAARHFLAPWLKAQVLGASHRGCQGRGGRPSPQAAWGGGAVSHPRPPPDYNFEAPPASSQKERTGSRAHTARSRHVFRARTRRAERRVFRRTERRVSRRAERRVSRRAERRVSRRATGASPDAQTSASSGAQPARLYGVRRVFTLNLSVRTLVLLL